VRLQPAVPVRHPFGTSKERRFLARAAMFLTFWRVIGAALLVLPVAVLLEQTRRYEPTPEDVTAAIVRRFAYEAFPQWAATNHVDACPASLAVLEPYLARDAVDAWDMPLELRCGAGYRGAYVRSAGADGRFDTADDITSIDE
jgi:hypothetical protein